MHNGRNCTTDSSTATADSCGTVESTSSAVDRSVPDRSLPSGLFRLRFGLREHDGFPGPKLTAKVARNLVVLLPGEALRRERVDNPADDATTLAPFASVQTSWRAKRIVLRPNKDTKTVAEVHWTKFRRQTDT